MWATTREGYRLNVDPRAAGRVAPLLRPLGLERLVRSQMASSPSPENLRQATERSLAGLARRSRYSGVMLYPNSTRSFAVFTAPAAGGPYRLLARPTASGELEVAVAFSPAAEDIPEFAAQPISGAGTVSVEGLRPRAGRHQEPSRPAGHLHPRGRYRGRAGPEAPLRGPGGHLLADGREVTPRMNSIRVMDPKAQFSFRVGVRDGGLPEPAPDRDRGDAARPQGGAHARQQQLPVQHPDDDPGRPARPPTHRGQAPRYLLPSGRRTQTLSGGPRSGSGRRYELAPPSSLGVGP